MHTHLSQRERERERETLFNLQNTDLVLLLRAVDHFILRGKYL